MNYRFYHKPILRYGWRGAIKWLVIANLCVYVLQILAGRDFIYIFGLTPKRVLTNLWLWQLVTYMFLHGGFFHLLVNLFILWMFGKNIENAWGTIPFLKYYFTCGIGAALFIILTSPSSAIPNIGASGAVYGILVAFGLLFPEAIIYLYFFIPMKAKHLVIFLGVIAFLSGLSGSGSNIAHFGHLGGLIVGYIYLKYPFRLKTRFRKPHGGDTRDTKETLEDEANRILDKILIKGVNSLTEEEKRTMDEYINRRSFRYH